MLHKDQDVIRRVQLCQRDANPRLGGQVKRAARLFPKQPIHLCLAPAVRERRQIDYLDRHVGRLGDYLFRPVANDADAGP